MTDKAVAKIIILNIKISFVKIFKAKNYILIIIDIDIDNIKIENAWIDQNVAIR